MLTVFFIGIGAILWRARGSGFWGKISTDTGNNSCSHFCYLHRGGCGWS